MTDREQRLLAVARRAFRYLDNDLSGNARNGPTDDIQIARTLADALAEYVEIPATADIDQQFPIMGRC